MWLPSPPPGDLPNPGIKPTSPALQADSLPSKPTKNPKNTGMGNLSPLQGIFPTQESLGSHALQADSLPSELPGKPIPKKVNAKECSNYHTIVFISHASKVMLKILQARLQQYVN